MIKLYWLKLELGCADPICLKESQCYRQVIYLSQLCLHWSHRDSGVTDFVKNFFREYAKILALIWFAYQDLLPLKGEAMVYAWTFT